MLRIRTIVSGETVFLDTYQNEPVLINLSFAELQDITKKNSAFSKSFSLPGSKTNNRVFNYFYDLNTVPTDFNPNLKYDTSLMWDGYEILTGNIRLNSVAVADGEIIYNVTFYNQIGDLMANIGDKFLFDLNLSGLSHPYSQEVIPQSNLDPTLFPITGSTNYSYQNGKILWGLFNIGYEYNQANSLIYQNTPLIKFTPVSYGPSTVSYVPTIPNFDFSGSPVRDWYFKPAIQVKELYSQIVNQAGYSINSQFFDTDYFSKYYMPLKFTSESIYPSNAVPACFTYSGLTPFVGGIGVYTGFTNPSTGQTCNTLGWSATTTGLTISSEYAYEYEIKFTFDVQPASTCDFLGIFRPNVKLEFRDGTTNTVLYNQSYCDISQYNISFSQFFNITGTSTFQIFWYAKDAFIKNFKFEIVNPPRFLISGTTIDYSIEFPTNDYKQIDFITSINKYFNFVVVPNPENPNDLTIEPIIDYIGKGPILDWTKKVDFGKSQNMFPSNALVNGTLEFDFKLDKDYSNNDFNNAANRVFGTNKFLLGQDYKDNTTKFDYIFGSPIDITIDNAYTPLLTVESMAKVQQTDKDGIVTQQFQSFKILPRLIYRGPTIPNDNWGFIGGATVLSGNAFCTSGITVDVTGAGYLKYTDCVNQNIYVFRNTGSFTIPDCANASTILPGFPYSQVATFSITSSGTTCTDLVLPEIFQYWYMNTSQNDRFTNLNRFTTYPYNYNDFSHYLNYRGSDTAKAVTPEYVFSAEDLYNVYYQDYIEDVISETNKIYSCSAYLIPYDIQSLEWNEKILIGNQYFRINKITNFNLLEPSLCELELIKLTRDYNPHRVLYYDLTPCAGGPVLHSNSDLMYHLYVYANNYVTLYEDDLTYKGCYGVTIGTYDSSYNYEHYYLSSAYTPNLIAIYNDCSCTGRTQSDIVQEQPGALRTFWYSGLTCDTNIGYSFSANTSPLTDNVIKITDNTTDLCLSGVNPTYAQIVTWKFVTGYTDCSTCNFVAPSPTPSITPSPTPTATIPVTPTPTPSPTPCYLCYEYSFTAQTAGSVSWIECDGDVDFTTATAGEVLLIQCAREDSIVGNGTYEIVVICGETCPTPEPTPSNTPTLSLTPSNTPTQTLTPTPSSTVGTTPPVTPTPTQTPTVSSTPPVTPTPTSTPAGGCLCYYLLNETGNPLEYYYTKCGEIFTTNDTLNGGANIQICSEDLPAVDLGITVIPCTSTTNCSEDSDCTGCF